MIQETFLYVVYSLGLFHNKNLREMHFKNCGTEKNALSDH